MIMLMSTQDVTGTSDTYNDGLSTDTKKTKFSFFFGLLIWFNFHYAILHNQSIVIL